MNQRHWSVNTEEFKRHDPIAYEKWALEQRINYGLRGEKLSRKHLLAFWDTLDVDPDSKKFLEFLLWPIKRSLGS